MLGTTQLLNTYTLEAGGILDELFINDFGAW